MTARTLTGTRLVELDEATRRDHLDRTARWFGNVRMVQAAFRQLAADTLEKVHEPHVRLYLARIGEAAERHEAAADRLFELIGRTPPVLRESVGEATAKLYAAEADVIGAAGGASAPWRDLQRLHLISLDAIGAFGAAEQLGLALGLPDVVQVALEVAAEKFAHHRQLQELVLDFAPVAILYDMRI